MSINIQNYPTIHQLYQQAHKQQKILDFLHATLPFSQEAIKSCFLENDKLIIYCSNAAWFIKVRSRQHLILEKIRNYPQASKIRTIQISMLKT